MNCRSRWRRARRECRPASPSWCRPAGTAPPSPPDPETWARVSTARRLRFSRSLSISWLAQRLLARQTPGRIQLQRLRGFPHSASVDHQGDGRGHDLEVQRETAASPYVTAVIAKLLFHRLDG